MSLPTLPSTTFYAGPDVVAPDTRARVRSPLTPLPELAEPRTARILSFDIENRPLSYWYDGNCTAEVTAIAWGFADEPGAIGCLALGQTHGANGVRMAAPVDGVRMLTTFVDRYNEADLVTGHYIRKHDLPIINGALVEHGLPTLRPKLTSDTRLDLRRWKDLPASQEALGAMLGLAAPKEKMSQADWRDANRLTPSGIEGTRRRVVGDVRQHLELRAALLERGLLKAPRTWRP